MLLKIRWIFLTVYIWHQIFFTESRVSKFKFCNWWAHLLFLCPSTSRMIPQSMNSLPLIFCKTTFIYCCSSPIVHLFWGVFAQRFKKSRWTAIEQIKKRTKLYKTEFFCWLVESNLIVKRIFSSAVPPFQKGYTSLRVKRYKCSFLSSY